MKHEKNMMHPTQTHLVLPRASALRWEIAAALCVKAILLVALWFLAFRGDGESGHRSTRQDVAKRWFTSATTTMAPSSHFDSIHQEVFHVR